jgi:YidC/Oxa1 family membrane protein insertase
MMEKRVLMAAALSVAFLALYTKLVIEPQAKHTKNLPVFTQHTQPEQLPIPTMSQEVTSLYHISDEEVIEISNSSMTLRVGSKSGAIHSAVIQLEDGSVSIKSPFPLLGVQLPSERLTWSIASQTQSEIKLTATASTGSTYTLNYSIPQDFHTVDVTLSSGERNSDKVLMTNTWTQADALSSRQNPLELVASGVNGEKRWYQKYHASQKSGKNVPRGTFLLALSERYFCQAIKHVSGEAQVKLIGAPPGTLASESLVELIDESGVHQYRGQVYFGPRDFFFLKQAGFGEAFKVGMLGQIGLILIIVLKWLAGITKSYGIAIILLSGLITGLMAPFTLISMRSMKKMQSLKPEIDRIMAKHKGNPQKGNQEVMALYKEHKVSPLSGCLPMFLQLPVFIALLNAITHFIGFRGAQFLWIKDLSLPDRAFLLPGAIPFIGNAINILPLAMAVLMYFQTKLSQQNMGSSGTGAMANPLAGPMMPVLFGVMFYQFPSALVLYWLTNSAMSIATYRLVR